MSLPEPAIDARGLAKRFRRGLRSGFSVMSAVDGVDLVVPRGSVYGLLGPNGAGKTTTIHMVLGLVRPSAGEVRVLGGSIHERATRRRVGYVPEKFELPDFLTARSFLELHAALQGTIPNAERAREVDWCLDRVSLGDRANDVVGGLSKGMQQRLAIAQALLGSPELVILDEPTSALDPIGRRDVRDLIRELRDAGCTVLLNSHLLDEVEQVCDAVTILERGRVAASHVLAAREDVGLQVRVRIAGLDHHLRATLAAFIDDLDVEPVDGSGAQEVVGRVAGEDDVARIADMVVGAGARLLRLEAAGESLEQLFLRTVEDPTQEPAAS